MTTIVRGVLAHDVGIFWLAVVLVLAILVTAQIRRIPVVASAGSKLVVPLRRTFQALLVLWMAVIAVVFFVGFAAGFLPAEASGAQSKRMEQPVVKPYTASCLVYSFPEPTTGVEDGDLPKELKLPDDPPGCLSEIIDHVGTTTQLILLGRTDAHEFSPRVDRGQYHANPYLALARAKKLEAWLQTHHGLKITADLLTAGPRYLGNKIDPRLLERDRSVEIRAHWDSIPMSAEKPASPVHELFNTQNLTLEASIAVLALMVALSAYLAVVGMYLRDQGHKLKKGTPESQWNYIQRILLILPDAPMILAALLLSCHVFFFFPPDTLSASILLFKMAIVTLGLFHMSQWIKGLKGWNV